MPAPPSPPGPTRVAIALVLAAILADASMVGTSMAGAADDGACHLTVGWENSRPRSFAKPDGTPAGLNIDLATALGDRCGCAMAFREVSWPRALNEIHHGRIDLLFGVARTTDRETVGRFIGAYGTGDAKVLFVRRDDPRVEGLTTMAQLVGVAGFRIGVLVGTKNGADFDTRRDALAAQNRLVEVREPEQLWRMLLGGRVDGFLGSPVYFNRTIAEAGADDRLAASGIVLQPTRGWMLARPDLPTETGDRLKRCLDSLSDDGTIARLEETWIGPAGRSP